MTAQPTSGPGPAQPFEAICLGEAAIVPLTEWVTAGRPRAVSPDEAMAELLRSP